MSSCCLADMKSRITDHRWYHYNQGSSGCAAKLVCKQQPGHWDRMSLSPARIFRGVWCQEQSLAIFFFLFSPISGTSIIQPDFKTSVGTSSLKKWNICQRNACVSRSLFIADADQSSSYAEIVSQQTSDVVELGTGAFKYSPPKTCSGTCYGVRSEAWYPLLWVNCARSGREGIKLSPLNF